MKVMITGASGFLGGRLAEVLDQHAAYEPVCGVRSMRGVARVGRLAAHHAHCDILDPASLSAAFEGADVVVHCAYADPKVIVEGTQNVLEAAQRCGVRKVVYMSSAEVYGPAAENPSENCPAARTGYWYGDAKIDAEDAWREHVDSGLVSTMLRPTIIYGPFSYPWVTRPFDRLRHGALSRLPDEECGRINPVYVDDVVSAILACMAQSRTDGEIYNVAGPEVVTWNAFYDALAQTMTGQPLPEPPTGAAARMKRRTMRVVRVPVKAAAKRFPWLVHFAANRLPGARGMMKRLEQSMKNTPDAHEQGLYRRDTFVCTRKLSEHLGMENRIPLERGMALCGDFLRLYMA